LASYTPGVVSAEVLEQIAGLLASLPDESVEGMLVFFDSLVNQADAAVRASAGGILRGASAACAGEARRERLARAALAVEAGEPSGDSAAVPEGFHGITQAEWDARNLPPPPSPEADEAASEPPHMQEEPARLPRLAVRHFFPGLLVRIGCDFADAYGRGCRSGQLYRVQSCSGDDSGWSLAFLERTVRLGNAGEAQAIGNEGNAWFQPVPTASCLKALVKAIDAGIDGLDEDEFDDAALEKIDALRQDAMRCGEWLSRTGGHGRGPHYRKASIAEWVFGAGHPLTAWTGLLFAAVAVCLPEA
jgi:hypothetical protein